MSLLQDLVSLTAAAAFLVSSSLNAAAPQHDPNGTLFLCNRQWTITEDYLPMDLVQANVPGQVRRMREDAAAALEEMFAACKAETGMTLISVSGYRSYGSQNNIYRRKLRTVKGNVEKAQEYVAPPGASEHQTGLAMDVGQHNKEHLTAAFGETVGGKWARENCWRFGFILRYDEGWEEITGYSFEPWHFRYVGRDYAKEIHEAGVPLETWLTGERVRRLQTLLAPADEPNSEQGAQHDPS